MAERTVGLRHPRVRLRSRGEPHFAMDDGEGEGELTRWNTLSHGYHFQADRQAAEAVRERSPVVAPRRVRGREVPPDRGMMAAMTTLGAVCRPQAAPERKS